MTRDTRGLTPTQAAVLDLLMDGAPRLEIAETLGITVQTIHNHISALLAHYRHGTSARMVAHLWRERFEAQREELESRFAGLTKRVDALETKQALEILQ